MAARRGRVRRLKFLCNGKHASVCVRAHFCRFLSENDSLENSIFFTWIFYANRDTQAHTHIYMNICNACFNSTHLHYMCVYTNASLLFFFLLFASFCALGILNCSLIAFIEFDGNLNFIYYLHIWLANAKIVKLININGLQLLSLVVFIVVMAACFPANERKQRLIRAGIIHAQQRKTTKQWEKPVKQQQCTKKKEYE